MIEIEKNKDIRKKLTWFAFLAFVSLTTLCYFLGWEFGVKSFLFFLIIVALTWYALVVMLFAHKI